MQAKRCFHVPVLRLFCKVKMIRGILSQRVLSVRILRARHTNLGPSSMRAMHTSSAKSYNPADTGKSFSAVPTYEILRASAIFAACSRQWLIGPMVSILRAAENSLWGIPLLFAVKLVVFPHFCAGQTMEDCKNLKTRFTPMNVKLMVDHSIEERECESDWALNLKNKIKLLERCRDILGGGVTFVPVKITALASPSMLEEMTSLIESFPAHNKRLVDPRPMMSASSNALLERSVQNLSTLCAKARELNLPLLLDAEQSHRQPAIDYISSVLMRKYNVSDPPVVYNTYQMYMQNAEERITRDISLAEDLGYRFAGKVVRGAYQIAESERAKIMGKAYPLFNSKHDTDAAYDRAVALVLHTIAGAADKNVSPAIMIATHNATSVEAAVSAMERLHIARDDGRVNFGQIMGMCDHITCALGTGGYNASKLVLYGDFSEIFPWLVRRLDENRDLFGAVQEGRILLTSEAKRRILRLISWKN
eukprot:m.382816 g.382816  ORF g.382816 m.382816 type:complete len:478 (+) comp20976_c0_seq19:186-1619(+)